MPTTTGRGHSDPRHAGGQRAHLTLWLHTVGCLLLALGILVAPSTAAAQPPKKVPRVGFLGLAPASAWTSQVEALRAGLRDLGYVEGQTLVIEFRWAARVDQMPELAAELVHLPVDVIVAPASTQVEPARQATTTIPIVFAQHADPVGIGHVASLARPGGNITGVSMALTEIAAKGLEILKEAVPHATRIGVLWNPTTPSHPYVLKAVEAVGASLGVQLLMAPVRTVEDFEGAFAMMAREGADGFLVPSSPLTNSQPAPLAALALQHRLPGMFANKANVEAGGLMSYGSDFNYMYRRTASYVDKILKGATPADLPVEQSTHFELVLNLKTAQTLAITFPPIILFQAKEVIK
jgi:putative tryptophan/tyrosine transport system substrate-binding protein